MNYLKEFLSNDTFFVVLFAWLFSCLLKGIIDAVKNKKVNWGRFFGPGGMPSSHTTIVMSLSIYTGISEGFDSILFVICCALALIVMYDASGIRRAAGQQARIINMIVDAWEESDPVIKDQKLKELLGHTPLEVFAGAILGAIIAIVAAVIFL